MQWSLKNQFASLGVAVALFSAPAVGGAAVLFQNAPEPLASDNQFTAPGVFAADNFDLSVQARVERIFIHLLHDDANFTTGPVGIHWAIAGNANNGSQDVPGTSLSNSSVTGVPLTPGSAEYEIDIPDMLLGAGRYWLTLQLDSNTPADVNSGAEGNPGWNNAGGTDGDGLGAISYDGGANWEQFNDSAFRVEGAVVPVPATLSLLGLGLVLLGARRPAVTG